MNNDLHTLTSHDFLDALDREQHLLEDPLQKVDKKKERVERDFLVCEFFFHTSLIPLLVYAAFLFLCLHLRLT